MPRVKNPEGIKSTADILHRASRPQQSSTYIPRTRDWRYASGIFRHGDNETEKTKTTWDELDEDYNNRASGRQGRTKRLRRNRGVGDKTGRKDKPADAQPQATSDTVSKVPSPSDPPEGPRSRADTTSRYTLTQVSSDPSADKVWKKTSLISTLKLPNKRVTVQYILNKDSTSTPEPGSLTPLTTSTETTTTATTTKLNSIFSPTSTSNGFGFSPSTPTTLRSTPTIPSPTADVTRGRRTRDRLEINTRTGHMTAHMEIQIRHVLTLPFMAMQSMVGTAFEMGIRNAEARLLERGSVGKKRKNKVDGSLDGSVQGARYGDR